MLALPCCRRGGSVDWDGDDAEGAPATGSEEEGTPPAAPSAARGGGGGGVRAACPPPSCRPHVGAVVVPAGGTATAVERGCSGPPRCG